jgi:hypothetical protein
MATGKFGENKFGTFKFGPTTLTKPRYGLDIDWDMDGQYDGRNDGMLVADFSVERGRRYYINNDGKGFEQEDTGRFSVQLVDEDRVYDPYNTSSPLYPNVGPGRFFRMRVRTETDNVYPLMAGTISEPVIAGSTYLPLVFIEGRDGWQYLRDQKARISLALQENIYADEAIQMILGTIGWPSTWGYDLDNGLNLQPFWWVDDESASAAMSELVFSELGRLWIAADGKLTFRNRHLVDTSVATITKEDIRTGTLRRREPWEVIRNSIRVTAKPRVEQATAELWRMSDVLRVLPGEAVDDVFAEFLFNSEKCPAKSVLQPVATTDYTANSNSDGSGTNLTANFTVTADVFSTGAKLIITNNSASVGYITFLRIRGNAIASTNNVPIQADDVVSQQLHKATRSFDLSTNWVQNTNAARSEASFLRSFLSASQKYLEFELLPNPDLQFSMDLGKQVDVYLPDDGIEGSFRVHYIYHKSIDRSLVAVRTTVMLEPFSQLTDEYWIVPHTVPMRVSY